MQISPDDLGTLGECDLDGVVVETFSAHPHFVAARGAFYNFGMRFGPKSAIDLYELPLRGPARRLGTLPLEAPTALHDFIATERHLVFFLAPTRLLPAARAARRDAARAPVRLAPRARERGRGRADRRAGARACASGPSAFFAWHFANAFERGERDRGRLRAPRGRERARHDAGRRHPRRRGGRHEPRRRLPRQRGPPPRAASRRSALSDAAVRVPHHRRARRGRAAALRLADRHRRARRAASRASTSSGAQATTLDAAARAST